MTTRKLAVAAVIGAAYTALTLAFAPISYGALQFRISEALTVLPFLYPVSVWGLFTGCFLANILGGSFLLDIIFGPLATLLAAYITTKIKNKLLVPLPAILINALVMGLVLAYSAAPEAVLQTFPIIALQVGVGQLVVCYGLGMPLLLALERIDIPGIGVHRSERRRP